MAANEIQPSSDKSRRLVAERSAENVEPGKLADTAERINVLHNRPTQIAVDADDIYILPAKQQEE